MNLARIRISWSVSKAADTCVWGSSVLFSFHSFQLSLQDTACHCRQSLEVVFTTYFGSWAFWSCTFMLHTQKGTHTCKCSLIDTQSFVVSKHRTPSLIIPPVSNSIHMDTMNHSSAISKDNFMQIHKMGQVCYSEILHFTCTLWRSITTFSWILRKRDLIMMGRAAETWQPCLPPLWVYVQFPMLD